MSRIVFGSANHWTSPYQVGSHAWARLFAGQDWQVAYLSDPITPWHGLLGGNPERNRERFQLWRQGGAFFENGRVRAWVPGSLIAPHATFFFESHWVMDRWNLFSIPPIASTLKRWGFDRPEVLWLDSPRHAGWGRRLNPHRTVLRVADWSAGFSNLPKSVLERENRAIREADVVVASAKVLEEKLRPIRGDRPLHTLRNGVDVSFWTTPCSEPPEYSQIPGPRIIYVGALDEWFDVALLREVIQAFPRASFVIIGQKRAAFAGELSFPNVHWLGSRPRESVRAYLQHAEVGIIPFKRTELIECVCPLKLYEYLACELPVVATRWKELEKMNSPARLATGAQEWIHQLQNALEESGGMKSNPKASQSPLLAYARANDWKQRWKDWESIYRAIPC